MINFYKYKNSIYSLLFYIFISIIFLNYFFKFIDKYKYFYNNKEITIEDKTIIDNELNAKDKDIIIILDEFNMNDEHGNNISDRFNFYFKINLKKEIDIKPIYLSFTKKENNREHIDLIENKYKTKNINYYEKINKESYSLETYIKRIRELNPNSKIVLSLSFLKPYINNKIVSLSKEYNFKIAQSYSNSYSYEGLEWTFFRLFLYDRTNTILVSSLDPKPLWYMKYISVDDFKHTKEFEDKHLWSTSYLTPVLGYEYYLNKDSNIINKK